MNQQITVQIEGVDIRCDCYVSYEAPNYFAGEPGLFECTLEGIEIGGVDVTELVTDHAPDLLERIEELCTDNV